VTLTFYLLTFVSGHAWRVTWSTRPPSLKILRLSVLELWVPTSPIGYHWQCVCSHCACAVSRDMGANFPHIFENPDPDLPIHYTTLMALRLWQIELCAKTVLKTCVKDQIALCACAKSRQPWTVTWIFYHHRSRRPRLPVNRFKFWQFDSI